MWALLTPRFWIGLALVSALAFTHGFAYKSGRAAVRNAWTAEKLAASETARVRERAAQVANERIDRDYQIFKARAAAAGRATADSLRRADDADTRASADTATECRADDPRPAIARECRSALKEMDDYARSLVGQVGGLQAYPREVCVTP